jgi:hypothetical protein
MTRPFSLWSFLRNVLEQGCAIQLDYEAGNFASYEHYSARLDEAARERESQLAAEQAAKPEDYGAVLASEINALPPKLRAYVHDLETRADPAYDVRRAFVAEENAAAMAKRVEELEAAISRVRGLTRYEILKLTKPTAVYMASDLDAAIAAADPHVEPGAQP